MSSNREVSAKTESEGHGGGEVKVMQVQMPDRNFMTDMSLDFGLLAAGW